MKQVNKCFKCDLALFRKYIINGVGNENANIMMVLNAPSKSDNDTNKLLSNQTGVYLNYVLEQLNIKDDLYTTYLTKCKTPGGRQPTTEETNKCKPHFVDEINHVKPRIVILSGSNVVKAFFGVQISIHYLHGTFKLIGNTLYCITYDITSLNKDTDFRKSFILDMIKFCEAYQKINPAHQFNNLNKLYEI